MRAEASGWAWPSRNAPSSCTKEPCTPGMPIPVYWWKWIYRFLEEVRYLSFFRIFMSAGSVNKLSFRS